MFSVGGLIFIDRMFVYFLFLFYFQSNLSILFFVPPTKRFSVKSEDTASFKVEHSKSQQKYINERGWVHGDAPSRGQFGFSNCHYSNTALPYCTNQIMVGHVWAIWIVDLGAWFHLVFTDSFTKHPSAGGVQLKTKSHPEIEIPNRTRKGQRLRLQEE